MKKLFALTLLLLSLAGFPATACLNVYFSLDEHGHFHHADEIMQPYDLNFNLKIVSKQLAELEVKLREKGSFRRLSDYSVYLMKAGKPEVALEILKKLARHRPKEYKIAANLGTAYELNGHLDSAYKYIERGMQLNPKAHKGSEWVHLKILETKMKLKEDPTYLRNHSVLGLTELQKKDSTVAYQINIQLHERVPFTAGPDPIMASLFRDLGDGYAALQSIEYAKALYMIGKQYYGDTSTQMQARIDQMLELRQRYASKQPEEGRSGETFKIGGIPYTELLIYRNRGNFEPDWSKLNHNADSLLALVNLPVIKAAEPEVTENDNELPPETTSSETPSDSRNYLVYFLVFIILIIGVAQRVRRAKGKASGEGD